MSDTFTECLDRARRIAQENGLSLNSDEGRVEQVLKLMAENYDAVHEWVCPCKQQLTPPVRGIDKICPCPEWLDEITRDGHCFCKLFFNDKKT